MIGSINVKIPEETSLAIERLFYEHAAGLQSIAFLTKDKDVPMSILKWKIDSVEATCAELEMMKTSISKQYLPDYIRVSGKPYDYEFLFDSCEIAYRTKED